MPGQRTDLKTYATAGAGVAGFAFIRRLTVTEGCAPFDPMVNALIINMYLSRLRDGIIVTNHFHRAAIARPVILNYHHAVRGFLLGANRARRIANISNLFFSLLLETFEPRQP